MIEVRITRIAPKKYEVCFVFGLLNTWTEQQHFSSVSEAKTFILSKLDGKKVPIITQ